MIYGCGGDYNIDFKKYKQHDKTDTFVNKIFSQNNQDTINVIIKRNSRPTAPPS